MYKDLRVIELQDVRLRPRADLKYGTRHNLALASLKDRRPATLDLQAPRVVLRRHRVLGHMPINLGARALDRQASAGQLVPLLHPFGPLLPVETGDEGLRARQAVEHAGGQVLQLLHAAAVADRDRPRGPPISNGAQD